MKMSTTGPHANVAVTAAVAASLLALAACDPRPAGPPTPKTSTPSTAPASAVPDGKPSQQGKPASSPEAERDKALAARVKEALDRDPDVNAHAIDVVARDGKVILFGTAETRARREAAGKAAAAVAGVTSVENRLAVVAGS